MDTTIQQIDQIIEDIDDSLQEFSPVQLHQHLEEIQQKLKRVIRSYPTKTYDDDNLQNAYISDDLVIKDHNSNLYTFHKSNVYSIETMATFNPTSLCGYDPLSNTNATATLQHEYLPRTYEVTIKLKCNAISHHHKSNKKEEII